MQSDEIRGRTGIVLSGGGARGAYEVGVLRGILGILSEAGLHGSPFGVYAGTSVGAIHATYLASHAREPDAGMENLTELWRKLDIREHMRPTVSGLLDAFGLGKRSGKVGTHLLDPGALERMARDNIDWAALHRHTRNGLVKAVLVAALDVVSGRTTIFGELCPDRQFRPTLAANRKFRAAPLTLNHVLGSAAIPLVFPARKVGKRYYCDGGLRFNTPMSPAIRAGADRLVIISLRATPDLTSQAREAEEEVSLDEFRNPLFLAGKLLDAIFLDPLAYDLHVLERFNRLLQVLEGALDPASLEAFERIQDETRGVTYRQIQTLVFVPSKDIGRIAGRFLAQVRRHPMGARFRYSLLSRSISADSDEADLPSYLMFDGEFAKLLIELGELDARNLRADILDFFAPQLPGAAGLAGQRK